MEEMNLLLSFVNVAPYINDLVVNDMAVAICDREKYVSFTPGKNIDFPVKSGDYVKETTAIYQAMREKQRMVRKIGSEVFGFPYIALAIPLLEGNQLIGAVCFLESVERQDRLFKMAEVLHEQISTMQASSQEIAAESEGLLETGVGLGRLSKEVVERIKTSQEITSIVKKISAQTNLLGLNAAIEAARLGELGRGFNVVAEEIRKLAASTKDSIDKIEHIVNGLQDASGRVAEEAMQVEKTANQQVGAIHQIRDVTAQLYELIERLKEEAESLS